MAVDLGINSDAVCTVMCGDGTVVAREFINFASEKAGLYTLLGRKKKLQSMSGNYKFAPVKKIITKINGVNDNLCNQTVAKIIKLARNYGVDAVVFEHLDFKGSPCGEKVHYWRKKSIIGRVCSKLHLYNIRYATVCAWNTSALAFDGSGKVKRDKDNHALCTFTTGKRYNCDLSASYNICARYFIREYLNSMDDKIRDTVVKASGIPASSRRVYADLIRLLPVRKKCRWQSDSHPVMEQVS